MSSPRHGSAPRFHVGTSGWHYAHWMGRFYPADLPAERWLAFYAERFATVEINASFYRLPSREVFAHWRSATPAGFRFAVKASRYLTHMKKFRDAEALAERERTPALRGRGPGQRASTDRGAKGVPRRPAGPCPRVCYADSDPPAPVSTRSLLHIA